MNQPQDSNQTRTAVALLRITLGIIILATWFGNVRSGLYTAEGLTGFFNWLFDAQNGNGSSLTFYKAFLDTAVVPVAGLFGGFQLVGQLAQRFLTRTDQHRIDFEHSLFIVDFYMQAVVVNLQIIHTGHHDDSTTLQRRAVYPSGRLAETLAGFTFLAL